MYGLLNIGLNIGDCGGAAVPGGVCLVTESRISSSESTGKSPGVVGVGGGGITAGAGVRGATIGDVIGVLDCDVVATVVGGGAASNPGNKSLNGSEVGST